MKFKRYILLITCILSSAIAVAGIPERPSYRLVNDYAGVFSDEQRKSMEKRLVKLDDSTGNQIAVVVVADLEGYDIAEYAQQIGQKWGVGSKQHNNGVVIVVKVKNQTKGQAFIAIGYGLEGVLPDITCKHIVNREMIPRFKENDYYGGVEAALGVIIPIVKGEYSYKDYDDKDDSASLIVMLVLFIVVVVIILKRSNGGGTTYSSGGTSNSSPIYWGAGGYGYSSSSSGSGFGGFGGGSFGGGGAGGSW